MASREDKRGGHFVLENRRTVGLFLLLLMIFEVVFTFGYLRSRSPYDSRLRAGAGKPREAGPPTAGSPPNSKGKAEIEEAASIRSRLVRAWGGPNNFSNPVSERAFLAASWKSVVLKTRWRIIRGGDQLLNVTSCWGKAQITDWPTRKYPAPGELKAGEKKA